MNENQASIEAWRAETFGKATTAKALAVRMNKEVTELLDDLVYDDHNPKALVECADVLIVAYGLAHALHGITLDGLMEVTPVPRPISWPAELEDNFHAATLIHCDMADLLRWLSEFGPEGYAPRTFLVNITYGLRHLAAQLDGDLAQARDEKMILNRARVWVKAGDGTGHHVRQEATEVGG